MAHGRDTQRDLDMRAAEIVRARKFVRGRFEEYDCVGDALVAVAEGAPDARIGWAAMEDDAGTVASALRTGRAELAASGRGGASRMSIEARLTSAVALRERLEEFLGRVRP